jgi:sugar phosphate isomerase/epimerase
MELKILSALWGYEDQDLDVMLDRIAEAGFDGVDTFLDEDPGKRARLLKGLRSRGLCLVGQQYQAAGEDFGAFKRSYLRWLETTAEAGPLLINSHTGRDYFSFSENLELVDIAQSLTERTGMTVAHETHRGRFLFAPGVAAGYFEARPAMRITADLSHWVVVSESFLEGFPGPLAEAIGRADHIHARVGYEQGPQVPDPRAPEWDYAVKPFLSWWDRIIEHRHARGEKTTTMTTEFGPVPYMHTIPFTAAPVADLFDVNTSLMETLRARYARYGGQG